MMAELQSTTNDSDVWRYIESTLEDDQKFRKNVLSRALCISEQNAYNEASIKDYSQKLINGKIESLNLTSSIGSLACTDGNFSRTFFDYFVLIMAISYGCLVAYATIQHYKHRNSSKGDGILRKFSIWYNWKKKTRPIMNEDYEKLKSIQGIRFYVIMGVLLIHTAVSYSLAFIKNTSEIEQCNPISWYLSADFQMYVATTLILTTSDVLYSIWSDDIHSRCGHNIPTKHQKL
ncbi:hypothetical protein JTB14_013654 [Gonioctena quinquepunctata]|nr:hypothetical protein JTB14_013654 [Gonioctena quinquepunctata]